MKKFRNGAYSGEHFLIISERSSYNATIKQNRIRCITDKHHMQSKYVTWYVHDHLAPLISISKVLSWSLSSPAWHHDLHHLDLYQCVVTWSSRQQLLLQLLLSHSDKVKQLFGPCILCNKETTIGLLPVADNFNKTWSSHTTTYISSRLDHITSQHALQNKLDVLYFVVASFTWLLQAEQEPFLPTDQNHNNILST